MQIFQVFIDKTKLFIGHAHVLKIATDINLPELCARPGKTKHITPNLLTRTSLYAS